MDCIVLEVAESDTTDRLSLSYLFNFSDGSVGKESACNAGATDVDSVPGVGRSPGEGNGSPLQYSCLKNPMDRGAWRLYSLKGCT